MKNESKLLLSILIGGAGISCQQINIFEKKQPNLVIIFVDDLGYTDLGYMGSTFYETPTIDSLANMGIKFTNAYASAANCAPSRACLMSGQWPSRHGIYTVLNSDRGKEHHRKLIPTPNNITIPDSVYTLAEILKDNGYITCHAGKWHLSDSPLDHGFDINIGGSHAGHPPSYFRPFNERKTKNKKDKAKSDSVKTSEKEKLNEADTVGEPNRDMLDEGYTRIDLGEGPEGEYLTDRITNDLINKMDTLQTKPFFINLSYYIVHTPLEPKPEKKEKYLDKDTTEAHSNAEYAAMIESLDENLKKIFEEFEKRGLMENTLFLFTSDNGGVYEVSKQWPLRAGKGSYYEGGIREPMFALWNNKIKPGTSTDEVVTNIDFYPTFLDAAGIEIPGNYTLDGMSILPVLLQKNNLPDRPLFWHFPIYLQEGNKETQDKHFRTRPGSAVRYGDWKLIQYFENNDLELYNLIEDIGEKNNLAESNPEKLNELLNLLDNWRNDVNAPIPTELNPKYDPNKKPKKKKKNKKKNKKK